MKLNEITRDEFRTALKDPRAEFVRGRVEEFKKNFLDQFDLEIDSRRIQDKATGLYLYVIEIDLDDHWRKGNLLMQHFPLDEFNVESGVRDDKLIYQIWETNTL